MAWSIEDILPVEFDNEAYFLSLPNEFSFSSSEPKEVEDLDEYVFPFLNGDVVRLFRPYKLVHRQNEN